MDEEASVDATRVTTAERRERWSGWLVRCHAHVLLGAEAKTRPARLSRGMVVLTMVTQTDARFVFAKIEWKDTSKNPTRSSAQTDQIIKQI